MNFEILIGTFICVTVSFFSCHLAFAITFLIIHTLSYTLGYFYLLSRKRSRNSVEGDDEDLPISKRINGLHIRPSPEGEESQQPHIHQPFCHQVSQGNYLALD